MLSNNPFIDNILKVARFSAAYLLLGLAVILNAITLPYLENGAIKIAFIIMAIYYWSVYRPTLLPAWLIFVVGLFTDIIMMLPLGFNTIIFLAMQKLIINQRRYLMAQPFILLWLGFGIVNALSSAALWGLYHLTGPVNIDSKGFLLSCAASFFVFPIMYLALQMTHKIIPEPETQRSFKLHRPQKH